MTELNNETTLQTLQKLYRGTVLIDLASYERVLNDYASKATDARSRRIYRAAANAMGRVRRKYEDDAEVAS